MSSEGTRCDVFLEKCKHVWEEEEGGRERRRGRRKRGVLGSREERKVKRGEK